MTMTTAPTIQTMLFMEYLREGINRVPEDRLCAQ